MKLKNIGATLLAAALLSFSGMAASAEAGKTEIQWLGQATTRITTPGGKVIVIDPWLTTNPKTPEAYKKLDALGKVDLILVTHGHGDHFGDAGALAKLTGAPVYGPAGLIQSAVTLGILPTEQAVRFGKSGTVTPLGASIRITATHAEHSSEILWRNAATGKDETHVGGEPQGYIIELENGFRIFHMGDTGLFGDMKLIGEYYHPDHDPDRGPFRDGPERRGLRHAQFFEAEVCDPNSLRHHAAIEGNAGGIHQGLGRCTDQGDDDEAG
jgi:L-ascorbate metabolism protein UlaG (beta-lactamase superfamily)